MRFAASSTCSFIFQPVFASVSFLTNNSDFLCEQGLVAQQN
jgi:hypothetical protein